MFFDPSRRVELNKSEISRENYLDEVLKTAKVEVRASSLKSGKVRVKWSSGSKRRTRKVLSPAARSF